MKAYLALLVAIVAPALADELQARGGGGDGGYGGGGDDSWGWGTTTEVIYTTSKYIDIILTLFMFVAMCVTWGRIHAYNPLQSPEYWPACC